MVPSDRACSTDTLNRTARDLSTVINADSSRMMAPCETRHLYDLDHEAAQVCREIGLTMVRAEAVNDDPLFLDMTADVVLDVWKRYESGRPLHIAPSSPPARVEGPPPNRGR